MPKFSTAQAMTDVQLDPTLPEIKLRSCQSALTRYLAIQERNAMAVAQSNQYNAEQDRLRELQENAERKLHQTEQSYEHIGKTVPKDIAEQLQAEVDLYKSKRRTPFENRIQVPRMDEVNRLVNRWNGPFVPVEIEDVEFDASAEKFAEVQEQTKALEDLSHVVEQSPRTKDEVAAAIKAELAQLRKLGPSYEAIRLPTDISARTGFFDISRTRSGINWPRQYLTPGQDGRIVNSLGLLCWLHGDAIEAKMLAQLAAEKDEGMSAETKIAKMSELHEKIVASLRLEDAILNVLESNGNFTLRKRHYHPAVLLGIQIARPPLIAEYT